MTQRERFLLEVSRNAGRCDDCLADALGFPQRQRANQLGRELEAAGRVLRTDAACRRCGITKTVTFPPRSGQQPARQMRLVRAPAAPASVDRALIARWDAEMLDIHAQARAIGYAASRFHQMLVASGGLAAAKTLINAPAASDGFTKLWELRRLDIAVEARALQPQYAPLFTPAELERCRKRLREFGWTHEPPWRDPSPRLGTR